MADKSMAAKKDIAITVPDYSQRKKIEVVALYQDNNYDLEKTAKETGISQGLIKMWYRELGRDTFKGRNQIEVVAGELQAEKLRIAEQVSLDLVKVRQVALQRLEQLILKSNNLEAVTKAIDALTRAIKDEGDAGAAGDGRKIGKGGVYQIINNQYNMLKNRGQLKNGSNKN